MFTTAPLWDSDGERQPPTGGMGVPLCTRFCCTSHQHTLVGRDADVNTVENTSSCLDWPSAKCLFKACYWKNVKCTEKSREEFNEHFKPITWLWQVFHVALSVFCWCSLSYRHHGTFSSRYLIGNVWKIRAFFYLTTHVIIAPDTLNNNSWIWSNIHFIFKCPQLSPEYLLLLVCSNRNPSMRSRSRSPGPSYLLGYNWVSGPMGDTRPSQGPTVSDGVEPWSRGVGQSWSPG